MPVSWGLELAGQPSRPLRWRFDVLHAIACRFFEGPDAVHEANEKCFSVRVGENGRRVVLTWLDDRAVPQVVIPGRLQVGSDEEIAVAAAERTAVGFEDIETGPVRTRWRLMVQTPALFRHHGLNYPLPDPQVMFAGLARRYRALRPDAAPDEEVVRQMGRRVATLRYRLRTERFSWHGRTDAGFVGQVELGLARSATTEAARAFTTLGIFAGLAGLGRGTTHGLGSTVVTSDDRQRPP
ncbi:CRISPR-associated protein, Cas6 family [Thermomonospora echinospora]|uniref:CRISPR-associated protein, Cas6 family n=1 Tax=Thermomonospora echinospora TaxID=1992 RepID=A0A1H6AJV5_9ACTN|nr:CRISPR system precrRNA processing endoribonuclease RAMP protein Cas6 [Thermomonospora echinospora]SEG48811.1 CRISPR-associated protein, Cas6 family [Thermomonospora echinospora]